MSTSEQHVVLEAREAWQTFGPAHQMIPVSAEQLRDLSPALRAPDTGSYTPSSWSSNAIA